MKRIILAVFVILATVSCREKRQYYNIVDITDTITFSVSMEKSIGSVVDSVTYLALETNGESVFTNADKMIIKNGRIYIGDYGTAKVVVFDMDGNFIFSINKRGRGPGEYLRLSAFTVDDNYIYLMDNDSGKLRKYSLSGEYLEEHTLPVLAWDIGVFDNGDLMLATAPLDPRGFISGQSLHRLFITDNNLKNIHTSLFEYEQENVDPVGKLNYLFEDDSLIIFHSVGSDIIHTFSKTDQSKMEHILVDFGDNKIPDKDRSHLHEIEERGYYYIHFTPIKSGNYLSLEISQGNLSQAFLYDMNNRQMLSHSDDDPIIFPYPTGASDGKFYTLMSGISQYYALIEGGFPKALPFVEKHLEQERTVMMIYHMKK